MSPRLLSSSLRSSSAQRSLVAALITAGSASALLGALSGCSGKPAEAPPAPPASASAAPANPPINKTLLGHFSTPDGMIGLVLDRSGDIVKIKLDKGADIIQLTPKEDRKHGDLVGHRFLAPDGKAMVYLNIHGGMDFYGPRDTLPLKRDADAEPLGAPTIAGEPKPPAKLPYEVLAEELDAISVVKKLGFKPEDSGNLAKVSEAIEKADKALFVSYDAKVDAASFVPAPDTISGVTYAGASPGGYPLEEDSKDKLGVYGGVIRGWTTDTGGGYMRLYTPRKGKLLADKTPGLVWEAGSTSVIFVTLDGGRYRVDISQQTLDQAKGSPLVKGIGAPDTWPPAIQHSTYDTATTQYLGKAGAIPTTVHEEAEKIDEEWRACANKEAKALKTKLETSKTPGKLIDGHLAATRKKCAASEKKMSALMTKFAEDRNKERTAVYEKAKAKFKLLYQLAAPRRRSASAHGAVHRSGRSLPRETGQGLCRLPLRLPLPPLSPSTATVDPPLCAGENVSMPCFARKTP